jgi:autophagy-related protein 2
MAIGSQKVIQDTLDTVEQREERHIGDPDEEARQISLYADQPLGIMQGLRGAYQSLERDLLLAKDAILAVPGEVVASGSAKGAAAAVVKQSPTIILRPALGAAKAIGQTLLGAGNTLDKQNLRRMDEVCHIVHYVLILLTTLQKYKRN